MEFENALMIKSSIENVFNFLDRMENFPVWNYAVTSVKKTGDERIGDFPVYKICRKSIGPRNETVYKTERIPNKKLTFAIEGGWFPYEMNYEFSQQAGETLLINTASVGVKGLNGVLMRLFDGNLKKAVGQNLTVLKSILEK